MTDHEIDGEYRQRHEELLVPLARALQEHLAGNLKGTLRIDRISARAKDPVRFMGKALKQTDGGQRKYADPFDQIQDQVGARVVVFYVSDVEAVAEKIGKYYRRIEMKHIVPDSPSEFGYVGKHFILAMPEDLIEDEANRSRFPRFFELQIKTLFQHAWSEAEHDLAYKPEEPLTVDQKRHIAFTAAQAWGADQFFSLLFSEREQSAPKDVRP
jgi:putative GTP pyrophosphokinase